MNGAPSSRGLIDCVPFVAELTFAGTVAERVEKLTIFIVADEIRRLAHRPFGDQIDALLFLQPVLDEVLPSLLQLRRPS